ncbi:MAG: DUF4105 domain-containing protein [Nevskiales bacterium]|nr:DUF4105 domain-containing protein [Nevskiales bacterium]
MRLSLFLAVALTVETVPAAGDAVYLLELQQTARAERLAEQPYWHRLLHYRANRLLPGVTSIVDSPIFFLAPRGKTDPQAELEATLASFFSDALRLEEPTQCRVRARYQWLKERLRFDPTRLPGQTCEFHDQWMAALNPASVAMVFAANDLNSPATMYGHTLLRVDGRGQTPDEPLLAYAVNYAAAVATDRNPVTYTLQGLAGGFVGEYSLYPYYEKVRQYARINHRDLWEYPLDLTPVEQQRLLWHLWEMRGVGSDYFFLTENCSYMLLSLIETAREDLKLTDEFHDPISYTMPVDTLRVLRDAGLLGEPVFRPSLARTLEHKLQDLSVPGVDWVLDYAHGRAGLEDARQSQGEPYDRARLLETTHDYLYLQFQEDPAKREAGLSRARDVLVARSRIPEKAAFSPVPVPSMRPEQGHETSRLDLGVRSDPEHTAAVFRVRAAYHDRLDPPGGYLAGSDLEFMDLAFLVRAGDVEVAEARLVSVQTVAPWSRAFKPWSWQVNTGLRRFALEALASDPQHRLGFYLDGGAGFAVRPWSNAQAYAHVLGSLDVNRDAGDGYALAGGLRSGLAVQWTGVFTQRLETDWLEPLAGDDGNQCRVHLGTQWQFRPRHGLRLLLNYGAFESSEARSAEWRWQYYF